MPRGLKECSLTGERVDAVRQMSMHQGSQSPDPGQDVTYILTEGLEIARRLCLGEHTITYGMLANEYSIFKTEIKEAHRARRPAGVCMWVVCAHAGRDLLFEL